MPGVSSNSSSRWRHGGELKAATLKHRISTMAQLQGSNQVWMCRGDRDLQKVQLEGVAKTPVAAAISLESFEGVPSFVR